MAYPPPNLPLRCCADPRHRSFPSAIIPTRSHSASHSSMACVVSTTVLPAAERSTASHIILRPSGHIPLDGSSRSNTRGSPTSATANDSLRLFPPLYSPHGLWARRERPTARSTASAAAGASARDAPFNRAYISAVSRPVIRSSSGSNCGQYPITRRAPAESDETDRPHTRAEPDVGACSPHSVFSVVDLPAPLTPRRPKRSPGRTPNVRRSTATRAPRPDEEKDAEVEERAFARFAEALIGYALTSSSRTTSNDSDAPRRTASRSAATSASSSSAASISSPLPLPRCASLSAPRSNSGRPAGRRLRLTRAATASTTEVPSRLAMRVATSSAK